MHHSLPPSTTPYHLIPTWSFDLCFRRHVLLLHRRQLRHQLGALAAQQQLLARGPAQRATPSARRREALRQEPQQRCGQEPRHGGAHDVRSPREAAEGWRDLRKVSRGGATTAPAEKAVGFIQAAMSLCIQGSKLLRRSFQHCLLSDRHVHKRVWMSDQDEKKRKRVMRRNSEC